MKINFKKNDRKKKKKLIYCSLGPGLFHDIIEKAKNMTVEERIELLENSKELATIHEGAARVGQTEVNDT